MALRVGGAAASAVFAIVLLSGCERLGLTAEDVIAQLPEDFSETAGAARIMPSDEVGGEADRGKKGGRLAFTRKPTTHDPYCGAVLRLIAEKAERRADYRKFLLPRTIIHYASSYPAAITVDLGDAAEEIRCIVPKGSHLIGLLPKFRQEWLAKIGQGGVADQPARATAVWSRMRSEDLKAGVNLFVSSLYHYPKEDFFPLFVSLVNPSDGALPAVEGGGGGDSAVRWIEGILLKRVFPRATPGASVKFTPGEDGRGWILMRPLSEAIGGKDVSKMEAAVVLASMALRDRIPCWFAIFPDSVFLFLGGAPGSERSYAFSVDRYLSDSGKADVYSFMDQSRSHYLGEATTKGEPKFVDAGDHQLFHPMATPKPTPHNTKAGGVTQGGRDANPFDSPR